ncbi:hypothetical protein PFISCL1PPCAC_21148 [Pristionchus fissidentatus]|uniref:Uncharacterized protein n=1 Tax=Pristionchus fissidentatus TaxID=1538716 RepID=A0AAV5WC65_9BILA|nr:hypothetical protein PFISCL1PPCAC_21148 [Pristionchus fissidentatus]
MMRSILQCPDNRFQFPSPLRSVVDGPLPFPFLPNAIRHQFQRRIWHCPGYPVGTAHSIQDEGELGTSQSPVCDHSIKLKEKKEQEN